MEIPGCCPKHLLTSSASAREGFLRAASIPPGPDGRIRTTGAWGLQSMLRDALGLQGRFPWDTNVGGIWDRHPQEEEPGSSPRLSPAWRLRNGFGEKIFHVRSLSLSKRGCAVPLRCPIRCPHAANLGVCMGEAPGPVPSTGTRPGGARRRRCMKESTESSPKPCSTEPGWLHPRFG